METNPDLTDASFSSLVERIKEKLEKITGIKLYIVFVPAKEVVGNSNSSMWRIRTEKKYGLTLCTIHYGRKTGISFNIVKDNHEKNYTEAYAAIKRELEVFAGQSGINLKEFIV